MITEIIILFFIVFTIAREMVNNQHMLTIIEQNRKLIDRLIAKSLNEVRELEINTSTPAPAQMTDPWENLSPIADVDMETFDKMIKKQVTSEEKISPLEELKNKAKKRFS